ncbi:MAG: hypothetical protein LBR12_00650, partial [Opitutaceae bacterium]|nr:hypothetical protein [Opitutaceae bacterium]
MTPEPEPPGSWREVARPPARRRALSPAAKRRRAWRVFKAVFYAGVLVGTIVGARAFHRAWRENPGLFRSEAAAAPLRTVEFS